MAIVAGAERVLVASATASAAATIDITTGIDSTYDEYELHLIGLTFSTDQVNVWGYFSTDGLSVPTYATSAGSYAVSTYTSGEGAKFYAGITQSAIWFSANSASAYRPGNAAGESMSAIVRIYAPADTSIQRQASSVSVCTSASGNINVKVQGSGCDSTAGAIDSIRLFVSPGTVSGEARLYGISKSV